MPSAVEPLTSLIRAFSRRYPDVVVAVKPPLRLGQQLGLLAVMILTSKGSGGISGTPDPQTGPEPAVPRPAELPTKA